MNNKYYNPGKSSCISGTLNKEQLADRIRKLYDNAILGAVATLINGCILVMILWGQAYAPNLIAWLVCVFLVFFVRVAITVSYRKAAPSSRDSPKWKIRFLLSLFFSGVLWGAPALFFFPSASIGHQVFIAFVTGGMVAGAVGSFTSILSAFYIFSIPALLPVVIRFFSSGSEIHVAMGFMTLLFFLIMSLTAQRTHNDYLRLLALRYENRDLVEELQQEIAQRKQAEQDLRQKNQQIETIVATRTAELKKAVEQLSEEIMAREEAARARKKVEDQLQTLNDELERRVERRTRELQETQAQYLHAEKLSAIGKLSASIAHEFNNPLQGVMAILKGLKKTAILEEGDGEMLQLAVSECERMKDLIRNLQEFNRPSSGKKAAMDVHTAINSLLLLCKSDYKKKQLVVVRDWAERLPQILAIPDQIKQVVLNLLTNAADACRPGGTITISTWREEKRVAVAIKDDGIGIDPGKMDMIFQPFYTTKPAVKGTGLGLSICHGIVQNHRGEIRVESEPGKGSTFTVLLPIKGGGSEPGEERREIQS